AQGRTQLEAVLCERDIKKVLLFDRRKESAEQLIADMQHRFPIEMVYAENNAYLKGADIICTATTATAPLFLKDDVKSGVHINSVGSFQPDMQELDPLLIKDAKVYSDQTGPVLAESGDFIKPIKDGIFNKDHIIGEIGQFSLNQIAGRTSEEEITIFKSVGNAIQDYAVGKDVYENSLKAGFGLEIELYN
ncbi:MAG: hypothetical protein GY732_20550, partial [Gammaproteobacteria bacterium]|nr:hypothetical protein [Gammaproteobacteria bacterium]